MRFVRNCDPHNSQTSPLLGMFLCQHIAFFLAWTRTELCNRSEPEESAKILARRCERLAASHVNSPCEPKTHFTRDQILARHIFPSKSQGIRGRLAVGRITYKFLKTLNNPRLVLPEKTNGIWKGCCDARFPWEKTKGSGAVGRITFKLRGTWNPGGIFPQKQKDFRRVMEGVYIRNRDGVGGMITFFACGHVVDAVQG